METKVSRVKTWASNCVDECRYVTRRRHRPNRSSFAGYGSNALSGMTKATLDPHGHLRQPGMDYY